MPLPRLTDHTSPAFIELVASIASRPLGAQIRLKWALDMTNSGRSAISIFEVVDGPVAAPSSLIVKQACAGDGAVYDTDAAYGPAWRLFNEWAALQFLTETIEAPLPCPRFYGGSREQGLIVMENLGDDYDESLYGDDPEAAAQYLITLVRAAGRLHGGTVGRRAAYNAIRQSLGPNAPHFLSVVHPPDPVLDLTDRVGDWWRSICRAFEIDPHPNSDDELRMIADCIASPGPFGALTHGDFIAGNDLRSEGVRKLIDFEVSDYRHALLDGAADPSIFHRGGRGNLIPHEVLLHLRDAYRAELAQGCPAALDDGVFYTHLAQTCAYRCLFQLQALLRPDLLTRNAPFGNITAWHRIIRALDTIAWVSEYYGHMPAMGNAAAAIAAKVRKRWPSEVHETPYFRAFQG